MDDQITLFDDKIKRPLADRLRPKTLDDFAGQKHLIGKGRLMHPKTRRQLYVLLKMLAEKGEDETFAYIRKRVLKKKR